MVLKNAFHLFHLVHGMKLWNELSILEMEKTWNYFNVFLILVIGNNRIQCFLMHFAY